MDDDAPTSAPCRGPNPGANVAELRSLVAKPPNASESRREPADGSGPTATGSASPGSP